MVVSKNESLPALMSDLVVCLSPFFLSAAKIALGAGKG